MYIVTTLLHILRISLSAVPDFLLYLFHRRQVRNYMIRIVNKSRISAWVIVLELG
jgi:hypothetical protein